MIWRNFHWAPDGVGGGGESPAAAEAAAEDSSAAGAAEGQADGATGAGAAQAEGASPAKDPTWFSQVSAELRNDPKFRESWGGCATISDAIRKADSERVDLSGYVKLPKDGGTREEFMAFSRAMGIPESSEGYAINGEEQLCEGIGKESVAAFKSRAFHSGLSNEQANRMWTFFLALNRQAAKAAEDAKAEVRGSFDARYRAEISRRTGLEGSALEERCRADAARVGRWARENGLAKDLEDDGMLANVNFVAAIADGVRRSSAPGVLRGGSTAGPATRDGGMPYSRDWEEYVKR